MKNLDQLRAASAIAHRGTIAASKDGGDAVSGFPMLVLTDGLLAALAFACEEKEVKRDRLPPQGDRPPLIQAGLLRSEGGQSQRWVGRKNPGEYTVARALAAHLSRTENPVTNWATADALLEGLAQEPTDITLRRATAEAIQFLNYLKRFVA